MWCPTWPFCQGGQQQQHTNYTSTFTLPSSLEGKIRCSPLQGPQNNKKTERKARVSQKIHVIFYVSPSFLNNYFEDYLLWYSKKPQVRQLSIKTTRLSSLFYLLSDLVSSCSAVHVLYSLNIITYSLNIIFLSYVPLPSFLSFLHCSHDQEHPILTDYFSK